MSLSLRLDHKPTIMQMEPFEKSVSWFNICYNDCSSFAILTCYFVHISSRYPKVPYDPVTKTGSKADYYTYGTICTEVEIDVLTGENQVIYQITGRYFF